MKWLQSLAIFNDDKVIDNSSRYYYFINYIFMVLLVVCGLAEMLFEPSCRISPAICVNKVTHLIFKVVVHSTRCSSVEDSECLT